MVDKGTRPKTDKAISDLKACTLRHEDLPVAFLKLNLVTVRPTLHDLF